MAGYMCWNRFIPRNIIKLTANPVPENIAFSLYENPELCFNWDMTDLVKIYDAGTPNDYTDFHRRIFPPNRHPTNSTPSVHNHTGEQTCRFWQ